MDSNARIGVVSTGSIPKIAKFRLLQHRTGSLLESNKGGEKEDLFAVLWLLQAYEMLGAIYRSISKMTLGF
jgi:hypothetical protein